jgi:hypothetical protein
MLLRPKNDWSAPVSTGKTLRIHVMKGRRVNWSADATIQGWEMIVGRREGVDGELTVTFALKALRVNKP